MFYSVREQLPIPPKVSTSRNRRNMDLWCEYHLEHDHTLSQCRELKKILDRLADEGKLDGYLKRDNNRPRGRREDNRQSKRRSSGNDQQSETTEGIIHMISGGYSEYYPSNRSIKDSVHTLKSMTAEDKRAVDGPKMIIRGNQSSNSTSSLGPHCTHHQGGSDERSEGPDRHRQHGRSDYYGLLETAQIRPRTLRKARTSADRFGGSRVCPSGTIVLPVRFGEKGNGRTLPVRFTVVDIPFTYNIIMGLPLINKVKVVISTHQLLIQYEKDDGEVGILYGNQKISRECQVNSLKMRIESSDFENESRKRKAEQVESILHVIDDDTRKTTQPEPVEGYEEVAIWGAEKIRLGKNLVGPLREDLPGGVCLLRRRNAWNTSRGSLPSPRHQTWL